MSYTTISAADFADLHRNDKVSLCIDVRTPGEFKGQFCLGSHNMPLQGLTLEGVNEFLSEKSVAKELPVYLMCLAGKRAVMAAEKLAGRINNPVIVVEGGVTALPEDVLETASKQVMPLDRQVLIAAGTVVLTGVVLGTFVSPWGYAISAFAGCGLVMAGLTNVCLMARLLAPMPWNRA